MDFNEFEFNGIQEANTNKNNCIEKLIYNEKKEPD